MSPLVTGYLLVTASVAAWSCIARQPLARNFAIYNLLNACVCILLDHSVKTDDWVYAFAFMDAFAAAVALVVVSETGRLWVAALTVVYLAQCGLHIAYAGQLISEHGVYRPALNMLFLVAQPVVLIGTLTRVS